MSSIVLTFALLFGAVIALICAVYTYIMHKDKQKQLNKKVEEHI